MTSNKINAMSILYEVINFKLVQGLHCGVLAKGRGSMDQAQGNYPVWLELARLVSSLLYGACVMMLVYKLNFLVFNKNKNRNIDIGSI